MIRNNSFYHYKNIFMKYLFITFFFVSHFAFATEIENIQTACEPFINYDEKNTSSIASSNIEFKKGVLWRIETPGRKTNYLFGTVHSQDYAVSKYPPQVRLALVRSKVLLMETVPDERANQSFINNMYFKNGEKLNEILAPPPFMKN